MNATNEPGPRDRPDEAASDGDPFAGAGEEGRVVARGDDRAQEARSGRTHRAGADPDVLLDVPSLEVREIALEVDELRARVSLHAGVASLVALDVGADVHLDRVKLDLQGVEARAQLKVHLERVYGILVRALDTVDQNPGLLEKLQGQEPASLHEPASEAERGDGAASEGQRPEAHAPADEAVELEAGASSAPERAAEAEGDRREAAADGDRASGMAGREAGADRSGEDGEAASPGRETSPGPETESAGPGRDVRARAVQLRGVAASPARKAAESMKHQVARVRLRERASSLRERMQAAREARRERIAAAATGRRAAPHAEPEAGSQRPARASAERVQAGGERARGLEGAVGLAAAVHAARLLVHEASGETVQGRTRVHRRGLPPGGAERGVPYRDVDVAVVVQGVPRDRSGGAP